MMTLKLLLVVLLRYFSATTWLSRAEEVEEETRNPKKLPRELVDTMQNGVFMEEII